MESHCNYDQYQLLADAYTKYRPQVFSYIMNRRRNEADAEDIYQDVFIRLMQSNYIFNEATMLNLLITIANNLMLDRFRADARRHTMTDYVYQVQETAAENTMSQVICNDIARMEILQVEQLPNVCQKVYRMSRFDDMSISDIAEELSISDRTVESHLFKGRKIVRNHIMKMCM